MIARRCAAQDTTRIRVATINVNNADLLTAGLATTGWRTQHRSGQCRSRCLHILGPRPTCCLSQPLTKRASL